MRILRNTQRHITTYLFLGFAGLLFVTSIISCGKNAVTSAIGSNIQLQVLNLSPDLQPINVNIAYIKRNTYAYSYPTPSGYFSIAADTPIQIKSSQPSISTRPWVTVDSVLKPNVKYSLFITGFRADASITSIFTSDTAAPATAGRGKIRFINASPRSNALDLSANGTPAFTGAAYKSVSKYREVPPGNYEFVITQTGSPNTILKRITSYQVQDGKLYTIYSFGIAGRTDSAAFGGDVLINK